MEFRIGFRETPTRRNPLGVKGAGQAGAIAAPPMIVNAIMDALEPFGVEDIAMPITAPKTWEAVQRSEAGTGNDRK